MPDGVVSVTPGTGANVDVSQLLRPDGTTIVDRQRVVIGSDTTILPDGGLVHVIGGQLAVVDVSLAVEVALLRREIRLLRRELSGWHGGPIADEPTSNPWLDQSDE
jgi:hypothetical protein